MRKKIIAWIVLITLVSGSLGFATELNSPLDYMRLLVDLVQQNYKDEVNINDLYVGAYKGIFTELDKHSKYYTEEEYNAFVDQNSGSYVGIGITLNTDFKVIAVTPDSPADQAGVKVFDSLLAVDNFSIDGRSLDEVNGSINGNEGTKVVLSIKREGYLNPLDITVLREKVVIQSVEYRMIDDVAILRIISFNDNTYDQVLGALSYFDKYEHGGIVIDVRDNPGGSLDAVISVADLFLPVGADIAHMKYRDQAGKTYFSEAMPTLESIVILINSQSASASEIFASALQGHNVAKLVGQKTFGKGTVQTLYQLTSGDGLKLTIGEFKGANNQVIDGVGVMPDYLISNVDMNNPLLDQLVPMNEREEKSYGDISLNVYGVQQRLKVLGYIVDVDGIYGPQTERVIKSYKVKNSLKDDRSIDYGLINQLNRDIEDLKSGNGEDFQLEKAIAVLKETLNN